MDMRWISPAELDSFMGEADYSVLVVVPDGDGGEVARRVAENVDTVNGQMANEGSDLFLDLRGATKAGSVPVAFIKEGDYRPTGEVTGLVELVPPVTVGRSFLKNYGVTPEMLKGASALSPGVLESLANVISFHRFVQKQKEEEGGKPASGFKSF